MRLQSLVEAMGTDDGVADGKENQNDRDDGEEGEGSPGWKIEWCVLFLVHSHKLE